MKLGHLSPCLEPSNLLELSFFEQDTGFDDVAWTALKYTREEVNNAARKLVAFHQSEGYEFEKWQDYVDALPAINNWRSSHSFPLNTSE
jgi:hypothetical protein